MVIHLWGKFFMAAWRGKRALTWITGAIAFLGSIGTAFTGYLSQTELRLAVDLHPGQGRPELGRHRRVVQRAQLRPDAAVARHAAAAASSGCSSCCTSSWSAATASSHRSTPSRARRPRRRRPHPRERHDRRSPRAEPDTPTRTATSASGPARPGPTTWSRSSSSRWSWSASLTVLPGRGVLLARRQGAHAAAVGQSRAERLRRHRGRRARRHQHQRRLRRRPTTARRAGRRSDRCSLPSWGGVAIPIDSAHDFVVGPLKAGAQRPGLIAALATLDRGQRRPADSSWASAYDDALAAAPDSDPAKVAAGDYGPVPVLADRLPRPGRSPVASTAPAAPVRARSTTPTTPSRCCSSPTAPTWRTSPAPSTWAATSGE